MHHSYWMVLDDEYVNDNVSPYCAGWVCTLHEFTIHSDVAQTIYISVSTWSGHHYPEECIEDSHKDHLIYSPTEDYAWYFGLGSKHLSPYKTREGQDIRLELYMNWENTIGQERDFSVVVWAESEAVEISHQAIEFSSHF